MATVSTLAKLVNNPCCESIAMVAAEAMPHHANADRITVGEFIGCATYRQVRPAQHESEVLSEEPGSPSCARMDKPEPYPTKTVGKPSTMAPPCAVISP